jgi:hypothetical protein
MNYPCRRWFPAIAVGAALAFCTLGAVQSDPGNADQREDTRLPNGKLQRDEILKAEHESSLKDAARLVEVAGELQRELEKNDRFVLSLASLKKTDEIESLVKKIRARLRRF